jgi:hypothetical protein
MGMGSALIAAEYLGYSIPVFGFGLLCSLMCKPGTKRLGFVAGASICVVLMLVGQARPDPMAGR